MYVCAALLVTANQFDLSPKVAANSLPVTVTDALWNESCTELTRPPRSPSPLVDTMFTATRWPAPEAYAASTSGTGIDAVQLWLGFELVASPASVTAGNVPPAV